VNFRDRPDAFPAKLLAGLSRCRFHDGRILVAVSGGADSVALLRGLVHLQNGGPSGAISGTSSLEIVVAHIDHQLREDSNADADWVSSLAEKLGLNCRIEVENVSERAAETQESIEEAARMSRYEALIRIAQDEDCSAIAVAHTADDQAETVLHHLVRGTSITGLRGMLWTRPAAGRSAASVLPIIRPMLDIRRVELEAWLEEIDQDFRTDPTNADETLTRNRIRHQLLPMLEREFNPQIRKALGTLAGHAAEVSDLLRSLADNLADASRVQVSENSLRIECQILAEQPPVLIRETLLTLWKQAGWPLKRMGHREWQKLSELVTQDGGAVSLPEKIEARRRGRLLILSREQKGRDPQSL
jgi:tRNA(Ile)-lysidine synthase